MSDNINLSMIAIFFGNHNNDYNKCCIMICTTCVCPYEMIILIIFLESIFKLNTLHLSMICKLSYFCN